MRYLNLFALQMRTSLLLAAQYRWDFMIDGAISMFRVLTAVVPLFVVYGSEGKGGIPGWSIGEALVVTGWFILMQGILEGAINPGLEAVIDHIRKGTLDFVLLKPADAQFLVSTSRFQPWKIISVFNALAVFAVAFHQMGRLPTLSGIAVALALLISATAMMYSLWILIVSSAFFVVKVDNLTYLFSSIFDAARWPVTVFKGVLLFFFTLILPLAVMTTYPAEALLGRLDFSTLSTVLLQSVLFAAVARFVWKQSLSHYSSAGG